MTVVIGTAATKSPSPVTLYYSSVKSVIFTSTTQRCVTSFKPIVTDDVIRAEITSYAVVSCEIKLFRKKLKLFQRFISQVTTSEREIKLGL